jgi:hypothetical protein
MMDKSSECLILGKGKNWAEEWDEHLFILCDGLTRSFTQRIDFEEVKLRFLSGDPLRNLLL